MIAAAVVSRYRWCLAPGTGSGPPSTEFGGRPGRKGKRGYTADAARVKGREGTGWVGGGVCGIKQLFER